LFHGHIRRAIYEVDLLDPATDPAQPSDEFERLRAQALALLGHTDRAIEILAQLSTSSDPDPHTTTALAGRILVDAGRFSEAIDRVPPPDLHGIHSVSHRLIRHNAFLSLGRFDDAIRELQPLVEPILARWNRQNVDGFEDDPALLTQSATLIDRWATLTSAYASRRGLHDIVLSMWVGAYDVLDRSYWPARLAAAEFQARHDALGPALEDLNAADALNPNDPQLNSLYGRLMLERRDVGRVADAIRSLRAVNPTDHRADTLEIGLVLLDRRFADAVRLSERAVERHPTRIEPLAQRAAAMALLDDEAGMQAALDAIDAMSATPSPFGFAAVGEALGSLFDRSASIPYLEEAIRRGPWLITPRHQLASALLHDGELEAARVALDSAYAIDPFNRTTVNATRLLDEMKTFKEFESDHFLWRYHPDDEPIVPLVIAPAMDQSYASLVERFEFAPDRKPIIEIFPDKSSWTVMAPRAGESAGPFNWYRVMTHEFTHTLNLMSTRGRVPRWLTEGLAVWTENVPYRFPWVPEALANRVQSGKLFSVADVRAILGGTRGGDPQDGELAYQTGFWIVRYIDETMGRRNLLALLEAYGRGLSEDDAFVAALGVDPRVFQSGFEAWARREISSWGYDLASKTRYDAIASEAEQLTRANLLEDALAKWTEASQIQPMNPIPPRRLAGILLRLNRPLEAASRLESQLHLEWQDSRLPKRLSRIYTEAEDHETSLKWARASTKIDPYDPEAHAMMAAAFQKLGRPDEAAVARELSLLLEQRRSQTPKRNQQ
jgi:tetratricopeptide (TPR) repeat protein